LSGQLIDRNGVVTGSGVPSGTIFYPTFTFAGGTWTARR